MFKQLIKIRKTKSVNKYIKACYSANTTPLTTVFPGLPEQTKSVQSDWKSPTVSNVEGVKVVNIDANVPYSFVSLSFLSGSRVEEKSNAGVATFIKHFAYKATPNYTQVGITRAIELNTVDFNSSVSREDVSFNANLARFQVDAFVPLLGEISKPKIREFEARVLTPNVIAEATANAKDTKKALIEKLHKVAFRGTGLGRQLAPLHGRRPTSGAQWKELLSEFRDTYFVKERALVVASGASNEQIEALVASALKDLPNGQNQAPKPSQYVGGESFGDNYGASNILIGFNGLSLDDPKLHALNIIYTLLGAGTKYFKKGPGHGSTSLLNKNVVERFPDNVFSAGVYNTSYSDAGLFGVYVKTNGNVAQVVDSVAEQLSAVSSINENQLQNLKNQLKIQLATFYESSEKRAELAKRLALAGQTPLSVEEFISKVDAVTVGDVKQVAKSVFSSHPTIVTEGDIDGLPSVSEFAKKLR